MSETARHQYENYRYCLDNGHMEWQRKAELCFNFATNKQWNELIQAERIRAGRPAFTFNIIESLLRAMKGMQRALRNDVRFAPVGGGASAASALVQDKLWMHIQNQNNLDFVEADVYERGLIMGGRGYYEVRMSQDDSIYGDVQIRARRSRDIVLDPSTDEYDTEHWPQVIDRRWTSYEDLKAMWGKGKADAARAFGNPSWFEYEDGMFAEDLARQPYFAHAQMEDSNRARALLLLSRQYYTHKMKEVFVDLRTGDTSEIPETWDHNRVSAVLERANQQGKFGTMRRKVKTVRWCISCNGEVMHDDDSPYKYFTIVPFFPTFIEGTTMGAVETLVDPQQLYNLMTNSEIHIITSTANSGYKLKQGALKNMTPRELEIHGARTGLVLEVDDLANIERLTPAQLPAGHDRLSGKSEQLMRNMSGVSNSGRGFSRDDASGDKVMQDQAAQDINSAAWLSNLHRSKLMLARRVQSCTQAHYNDERELMVTSGSVFAPRVDTVTINDGSAVNDVTMGKYTSVLVPSPARTQLSAEDFKTVLALRTEAGIMFPDELLIELSPASNKAELIQMVTEQTAERQRREAEAAAQERAANIAKSNAAAENSLANADLARARAGKFQIEAATDPDAAFERVEQERIAATREDNERRAAIDRERIASEDRRHRRDMAIALTKIDSTERMAKEKNDATVRAAALKPPPKPPAKAPKK